MMAPMVSASTAVLLALRRGPVYGRELIRRAMRARLLFVDDLGEAVERLRVSLARETGSA